MRKRKAEKVKMVMSIGSGYIERGCKLGYLLMYLK